MAKLTTLVENTSSSSEYKSKHGLCLYIETSNHKILFDLGPNGLFIENAQKMGIDIKAIDTVVISHGHADHGGALKEFLAVNNTAKVYLRENAFDKYYTKVAFLNFSVGLDEGLKNNNQIVLIGKNHKIDDELSLFSDVTNRKLYSKANDKLFMKKDGKIVFDSFEHEQNLVISENGKDILLCGCSHNGIVNIIEKYHELYGSTNNELSNVIGGFHMFNPVTKKYESDELIDGVAKEFEKYEYNYYTCHCTGVKAYNRLKETMKDKLGYLSVGTELEL